MARYRDEQEDYGDTRRRGSEEFRPTEGSRESGEEGRRSFSRSWEEAEDDWSYHGGRSAPPIPGQSVKYGDYQFENRYDQERFGDNFPPRGTVRGQLGNRDYARGPGEGYRSSEHFNEQPYRGSLHPQGQESGRHSFGESYGAGFDRGFADASRDMDRYRDQDERFAHGGGARRFTQSGRSGRFYGVGPQGYTRSDQRLEEEVCEVLTRDPDIDASTISVAVKDGEVTLKGTVSDRGMKYAAEECVEAVLGVKEVHNQLSVKKNGGGSGAADRGSAG